MNRRKKIDNNTKSTVKKNSVRDILMLKENGEKVVAITAYDYSTSVICDKAGVDIILVGDSAGMVMLGQRSTTPTLISEMLVFCKGVSNGTRRAMVVGDLPFGSYQSSKELAVDNAVKFIKSGCDAVKLEGGTELVGTIKALVSAGIPVMGHLGLKPQTSFFWDRNKVQAKSKDSSIRLIAEAKALEQAGVFSIILEMVTSEVAHIISRSVTPVVIGIGSGPDCDGQVLVLHDALGLYEEIRPRFVKRYANLSGIMFKAISRYKYDVKCANFPEDRNTFHMSSDEYLRLQENGSEPR